MNYNDRDNKGMNANLQNGYFSSGISLLNNHKQTQFNESTDLNEIIMGVENGDVNDGHCYINSPIISEAKYNNSIDSTNKRDKISPNRSKKENTVL